LEYTKLILSLFMEFKFLRGEIFDRNVCWRSQNGRDTPIFYMTASHIENTISCLRGVGLTEIPDPYNGKTHDEWIRILTNELTQRLNENG
jgi:hypothetical protein